MKMAVWIKKTDSLYRLMHRGVEYAVLIQRNSNQWDVQCNGCHVGQTYLLDSATIQEHCQEASKIVVEHLANIITLVVKAEGPV
jgi:ribosomal protein S27E